MTVNAITMLWAVYATSTLAALVQTYREQQGNAGMNRVLKMVGLILCLVWPLVAVVILVLHSPFQTAPRK